MNQQKQLYPQPPRPISPPLFYVQKDYIQNNHNDDNENQNKPDAHPMMHDENKPFVDSLDKLMNNETYRYPFQVRL